MLFKNPRLRRWQRSPLHSHQQQQGREGMWQGVGAVEDVRGEVEVSKAGEVALWKGTAVVSVAKVLGRKAGGCLVEEN